MEMIRLVVALEKTIFGVRVLVICFHLLCLSASGSKSSPDLKPHFVQRATRAHAHLLHLNVWATSHPSVTTSR